MAHVHPAQPYQYGKMGSLGNANYMLIRQHEFPHEYNPHHDILHSADHDRCQMWDYDHYNKTIEEHVGRNGIENFAKNSFPEKIFEFLIEMLKADKSIKWTGFRILGTVNRSNGFPVYSLELFSNVTGVPTYNEDGPNVEGYKNGQKRFGNGFTIDNYDMSMGRTDYESTAKKKYSVRKKKDE